MSKETKKSLASEGQQLDGGFAEAEQNKLVAKSADVSKDTKDSKVPDYMSNFSEFIHHYLRQYINLADQKAGFVFALSSAIFVYIFLAKFSPLKECFVACPLNWHGIWGYLALTCFFLSSAFCVWVVLPNLNKGKPKTSGFIFWEEIKKFANSTDYFEKISKQTEREILKSKTDHVFILAKICSEKYLFLKIAMYFFVVGFIFLLLYLWPILPTLTEKMAGLK